MSNSFQDCASDRAQGCIVMACPITRDHMVLAPPRSLCVCPHSNSVGSLGGFLFSSILYPVCFLNVFLVLGVRVRVRVRVTVRVTEPPAIFPIYSGVKFIFPSIRTRSNSVYRLTNEITPVSAVCCPWIPLLSMCLPPAIVRGMIRSIPE